MKNIVCPISTEKVNERVVRLNALLSILLVIGAFVSNSIFPLTFLMVDFFIRAFTKSNLSPISFLSKHMVNTLNLSVKSTDKAPKIFAARIGFLLTSVLTLLFAFELTTAALMIGGILVFFASLEFALAICVGCILYHYVVYPFYKE